MPSRTAEEPQAHPPIAVVLAWRAYLREVRAAGDDDYAAAEQRAWERLSAELARLARAG